MKGSASTEKLGRDIVQWEWSRTEWTRGQIHQDTSHCVLGTHRFHIPGAEKVHLPSQQPIGPSTELREARELLHGPSRRGHLSMKES